MANALNEYHSVTFTIHKAQVRWLNDKLDTHSIRWAVNAAIDEFKEFYTIPGILFLVDVCEHLIVLKAQPAHRPFMDDMGRHLETLLKD